MRVSLYMNMLLAAAASLQAFGSEGDKYCPQLPRGSGYVWEWVFRVDWGNCIGRVAKTKEAAFEISTITLYGVVPPGLFEPESAFVESGSVDGVPVKWHKASDYHGSSKLAYRTVTLVDSENQRYLSARVYANSQSQMRARLHVLEHTFWPQPHR